MKKKNPVGRPKVAPNKRRIRNFCIACTESEMKTISVKAKRMGVPMASFIRQAVESFNVT